jgi:hypothetical protein
VLRVGHPDASSSRSVRRGGHIALCAFGTGPAGGPAAPATALAGRPLTQRQLALFLGAGVQARRHRELSDKALTPLLGEGRVRRPQEAAGPTPYRHLLVAGAPGAAGKGRPLRTLF